MSALQAALNWLSALPGWIQTGERANLIYFCLALALLLELTLRVLRRFVADLRARSAAADGNQRLKSRLRKTPTA
jgi:hypothetical protein